MKKTDKNPQKPKVIKGADDCEKELKYLNKTCGFVDFRLIYIQEITKLNQKH